MVTSGLGQYSGFPRQLEDKYLKTIKLQHLAKVESSNLDLVGFDSDSLFIKFKNGTVYQYPKVSKQEHDLFLQAESLGKHFNQNFRKREEFQKLEDTKLEKHESPKKQTDGNSQA